MKTHPFTKFSLCLMIAFSSYAQTSKTYTEKFDVNKDVEVFLNTDHAEITVETWNKNRVEVEATISIDIEDEKLAKEILENFEFEALGNSSKVEIRAGRNHRFLAERGLNLAPGDFEILTEDVRGIKPPKPPRPPLPPTPNMNFNFDMDKFNEEGKAYILKFQEDIKEIVNDTNFRNEMKDWQMKFEKEIKESGLGDSLRIYTLKIQDEIKPKLKVMRERLKGLHPNHKIEKKIIIKMPKDAKLDLDVKRSQLKIASLYQIDANLNYSGLHIDELTGDECSILANYSDIDISKAKSLNLNLKYAKKVNIGEIEELVSVSKTSNLFIDKINQKALIEGSFGDLVIKDISKNFSFIDINLKNSSAKLNLPEIEYNFYINSKSSDFNMLSDLDYKVNEAFDSKIYQNKKTVSSSKVLNIKADYSNFELY